MSQHWIDVSAPLYDGMVHWPGDPPVSIERIADMEKGDVCNVTKLAMTAHCGTHMDAPRHFVRDGVSLEAMPLELAYGRARVIEIEDPVSVKPQELRRHRLRSGERILLKTANSTRRWTSNPAFLEDYIYLAKESAPYLAERDVKMIGIDYLSIARMGQEGDETHRLLLQAGIWIIEGLDLHATAQGSYQMVCLPLRIQGADGAPARVLLSPSPYGRCRSRKTR